MDKMLTAGFLAWVVISFAAFSFRIDPIQQDLKQRTEEVLFNMNIHSLAIESTARDVTLTGSLPSKQEKEMAVAAVNDVYGVRRVVDKIEVAMSEQHSEGKGITAVNNDDWDNDGVSNNNDAFPNDSTEQMDSDRDGIGDNRDTDDDGDGVADIFDAFPQNPLETLDTDGDGRGNVADSDDDNDGVPDVVDAFPFDNRLHAAADNKYQASGVDDSDVEKQRKSMPFDVVRPRSSEFLNVSYNSKTPVKKNRATCGPTQADRPMALTVHFDTAAFWLPDSVHAQLESLVDFALRCPDTRFSVVGHTDSRGNTLYNANLSRERAEVLRNILIDKGIADNRLFVVAAGARFPVASNHTVSGRAQNRRVEIGIAN